MFKVCLTNEYEVKEIIHSKNLEKNNERVKSWLKWEKRPNTPKLKGNTVNNIKEGIYKTPLRNWVTCHHPTPVMVMVVAKS